ncbi:MAG: histidine kinase [Actinocatenispora sp.]
MLTDRPARTGRAESRAASALVVVVTVGMVAWALSVPGAPTGTPLVLAVALIVLQGVALLRISSAPMVAAAVLIALGAGLELLIPPFGPGLAVPGLFSLALLRPPRVSLWALAGTLATVPLVLVGGAPQNALVDLASAVAAWSLGELLRTRRERRMDALRAVAEQERAALAREVHDIVGHSLAMIIVQAGAAEDVFDRRPDRAREAVRAIDTSARSALAEVRRVIAGPAEPHGLSDLDALAAGPRKAGLTVDLRVDGDPALVPAAVAGSTYRIVQESLTNALRHSGAGRVDIVVTCDARDVSITVQDDGAGGGRRPAAHRRSSGTGILGMRARAELHGGSCDAAPLHDGGFRVQARLPVGAAQ